MRSGKFIVFLTFLILAACRPDHDQIIIAAASSTRIAMLEMVEEFQKETGHEVTLVTGSSGKLTAQIMEGAPYAVFLSADMLHPQKLVERGMVQTVEPYAEGVLVLWSVSDQTLAPDQLTSTEIDKIALANPELAPYGQLAVNFMEQSGNFEAIEQKLVYGESVSQVNQFVVSRSVDAGFTSKSVVVSGEFSNIGSWIELNTPEITHGMTILKEDEIAIKFGEYLYSEKGKSILKKHGFSLPNE